MPKISTGVDQGRDKLYAFLRIVHEDSLIRAQGWLSQAFGLNANHDWVWATARGDVTE
jgi:hypothetical protein